MSSETASFIFSPRILEHLGISAYNSIQKCLAELAANAYDADATEVYIVLPDIVDENAIISVTDNGSGMSTEELKNKFLYIGRDRRSDGERTSIKQRLVIGSKGIGKLAGFGIASRIRVVTRKSGVQSTITIDRSDLDSVTALAQHKFPITVSQTEVGDGTTIELVDLHEGLHLPAADVLRRHLRRSLPQKPDFTVWVNDIECTVDDIHGERSTFTDEIDGVGTVSGFYIVANRRQPNPGLAVRVRGRIVQEPSLFGLDTRMHGFFTAEKIVGEINAEFLDPESTGKKRHDLIKTSRDGFLENSDIVQKFEDWASNFIRKVIQGVDKGETKKRVTELLATPEVSTRLKKLPPHVRGTASKVVEDVVRRLSTASDDDAKRLVEWVLRYYESNVLKELMNSIASADIDEAEKLAELINEWGLRQLNSIVGIVETQVDIIGRLEELVASDKAYELDLHKLIESNLWLVKDGLETWSSDKPLKIVLEGKLNEMYKDSENLRPDLICRSRDEGSKAIILEFKRPKERIVMKHVTQVLGYKGIIEKHRPNIEFTTYLIGREYDADVLTIKDGQAKAGLHLWSFEEILQRARARFESILEILGK